MMRQRYLPQRLLSSLLLFAATALLAPGCERKVEGPIPKPTGLSPQAVCTKQLETEVVLTGEGFSPAPLDSLTESPKLALPQVSLKQVGQLDGSAGTGEPRVLNPDAVDPAQTRVRWYSQERMAFTVDEVLALAPGLYEVQVRNPTGGEGSLPRAFAAVPPPVLSSVRPSPVCTAQAATTFTLEGQGFLQLGTTLPTVALGPKSYSAQSASGCQALDLASDVKLCTTLTVSVPAGDVPPGSDPVTVTNPAPANCHSSEAVAVEVVPPPTLTAAAPDPVCNAQGETTVTLTGTGFLRLGTALPSVQVGEVAAASVAMVEASCAPLPNVPDAVRCTELRATLPEGSPSPGTWRVRVENPAPAGCATQEPVDLRVVPPPEVTDITPASVCSGGGTFTVTGTNLWAISATLTDASGGQVQSSNTSVSEDATSAQVTFGGGLKPGTYTLSVQGAGGCSTTFSSKTITVSLGPSVLYVDPPSVFNGVAVRATLYVSNVNAAPSAVVVTPHGGGPETALQDVSWSAQRPNVLQATIPAGLAAGTYDIFLRGVAGCDAFLPEGLTVVSETVVALATPALQPGFGLQNTSVAVTVYSRPAAELPQGQTQFKPTPRVYLFNATLGVAAPLRAVAFEEPTRLTAIVPPLPAGTYDLVVVNPDATVGFQAGAWRSTEVAPPSIDDVVPSQLSNDADATTSVVGQHLAPAANMAVVLTCQSGGTLTTYPATVNMNGSTDTALSITVPTKSQNIPGGAACAVRVTNTANDTFDEWAALSVTNPAGKLDAITLATPLLTEPRRAPATVAGRVTREARFVYALGGDNGTLAGAKSSIEAASLGRFGDLSEWRRLPYPLPAARTLAAAHTTGRYVFVLGGHDGSAPVKDIFRATLLDPLKAPELTELDVRYAANQAGLPPGAYTYVVAAVFSATDLDNPGGESLPSEPATFYAPDVPGGVEIQLTWNTVLGTQSTPAAAYRVYRTLTANGTLADLRLLAEVPAGAGATQTYTDMNAGSFADANKRTLRIGDLGTWRKVGELGTARAAFGFSTATDPGCAEYWYVIGGMTAQATESSSFEYAAFTPSTATPGAFTSVTSTQLTARRELGTWVANATTAPSLYVKQPDDTYSPPLCTSYVYAAYGASGALASPSAVTDVRYAQVLAGGVLGSNEATPVPGKWLQALSAPASKNKAGFAAFMTSNAAYTVGGKENGIPTGDAIQAVLCAANSTACATPTLLQQWSDATADLQQSRYLPGMARLGAFTYFIGGSFTNATGQETARATTEYTVR